MEHYIFTGKLYPDRIKITVELLEFEVERNLNHEKGKIKISFAESDVSVEITTETPWGILDVRNVALFAVQNELNLIGFFLGCHIDVDLANVHDVRLGTNADLPATIGVLAERFTDRDLNDELVKIKRLLIGEYGILLNMAVRDMNWAMKDSNDTAFFCFRAIESLRNHCAETFGISRANEDVAWVKFREISSSTRPEIKLIQDRNDAIRHGRPDPLSDLERAEIFNSTWTIAENYFRGIEPYLAN